MTHIFKKDRVEPMPVAFGQCLFCPREPARPNSHLGVSYGERVNQDGTCVPFRVVLMHGCEWHAWQWARGKLAKPLT